MQTGQLVPSDLELHTATFTSGRRDRFAALLLECVRYSVAERPALSSYFKTNWAPSGHCCLSASAPPLPLFHPSPRFFFLFAS